MRVNVSGCVSASMWGVHEPECVGVSACDVCVCMGTSDRTRVCVCMCERV